MKISNEIFCIEITAPFACFTQVGTKINRLTQDIITPSSVSNAIKSIYWHPAIEWKIVKIQSMNKPVYESITRNEIVKKDTLPRRTTYLRNVRYFVWFKMIYKEPNERVGEDHIDEGENMNKYIQIFLRRARNGQEYNKMFLGTSECVADWRLIEDEEYISSIKPYPLNTTIKNCLARRIYMEDFTSKSKSVCNIFFDAEIKNGLLVLPSFDTNVYKVDETIRKNQKAYESLRILL